MMKEFIEKAIKEVNKAKNPEAVKTLEIQYGKLFRASSLFWVPNEFTQAVEKKKLSFEKKMTYKEFRKTYEHNNKWKFDLFDIVCKKCGSNKVEFNGNMKLDCGYYEDFSVEGRVIIKCHSCGNAFTLEFGDLGEK